jgi:hypothetical protein
MLPLTHFREIHPLIKAHCDAQHDHKRHVQNDSRAYV